MEATVSERLDLRELARDVRRLWWIPAFFALAGLVVGNAASARVPPVFRSQATVLVGPTNGAVTHTSTIRTSEDLANFYADMARRQILLEPVAKRLDLPQSWAELRDQVSAVVPKENLRLVTVTVMGESQDETDAVANELVDQLVALSPAAPGSNNQAFINEQADSLKKTIKQNQERILRLEAEAEVAEANNRARADALRAEITDAEDRVGAWQRIYVELIGTEPTSDAGGLQVLDEATAVTAMDRSSPIKRAAIAGFVGGVLGLLAVWLLRRRKWRRTDSPLGAELHAVSAEPLTAPDRRPVPTADPTSMTPRSPTGVAVRARTRK